MSDFLKVGIMGCGNISKAYFQLSELFKSIKVVACADLNPEAASARAKAFGVKCCTPDEMLADSSIDIIVNLTIPAAHYDVSMRAIQSGKHVYSEKPFVLSLEEGKALAEAARKKNVCVGSAPDTFLGGAHQRARSLADSGIIGKIVGGTCHVMSHGMEEWHPNPDFFFQPGGGPVLDMGPYYVTNLIQLIGPVSKVAAMGSTPFSERVIGSKPRAGEKIPVDTPTTFHSVLEFQNGAVITLGASWDVWKHEHGNMELYGTEGTMILPDPNFFGGDIRVYKKDQPVKDLPEWNHPFSVPNDFSHDEPPANYRTSGLADMAEGILKKRAYRCSLELALHAVDVMTSILRSAEEGKFINISTVCERPPALSEEEAGELLAS